MEGIEQGDGEDDDDKHDEGKGPAVAPELAAGVLAAHHDIGDVASGERGAEIGGNGQHDSHGEGQRIAAQIDGHIEGNG